MAAVKDAEASAAPSAVDGNKQLPASEPDKTGSDADALDDFSGFEDFESEFDDPEPVAVSDPLAGYNRAMTTFNDKFYLWALKPVAKSYRFVLPKPIRVGIKNIFNNILFPQRLVNNLLQFKLKNAGIETGRFVVNTTIGLAGIFDPAEDWLALEARDEDFGQTLGVWGVGPGPHLVLPFFGPSNLRDTFALPPDWFLNPVSYLERPAQRFGAAALDRINFVSLHLGEYENLKKDAVDFYPFMRDAYEQNRKKKIEE